MTEKQPQAQHVLLALRDGKKSALNRIITDIYHRFQKSDLFGGRLRTYQPLEDGGIQMPPESQMVQARAADLINQAEAAWTELLNITASIDATNCTAYADVVVGDTVILKRVPAVTLLWLEKQLVDMLTMWTKQGLLDPARTWQWDDTTLVYRSEPVQTSRSDKVRKNHVLAPATEKHQATVEVYTEDRTVGYWTTVTLSGLQPVSVVSDVVQRLNKLAEAVKIAREEANRTPAVNVKIGEEIFKYLHPQV